MQFPICGQVGAWQRSAISGRIHKPKLANDEAKLKLLCTYCREGNFREFRALAVHYPYLLAMTDADGFSPLHHAEISGDPSFVDKMLQIYRDPKTYSQKAITYETADELEMDMQSGFSISLMWTGASPVFTVTKVDVRTKAAIAGVMLGDTLQCVRSENYLGNTLVPPETEDVLGTLALGADYDRAYAFPLIFELRGPATAGILLKDGFTPAHAAAGMHHGGSRQFKQILQSLVQEQKRSALARDAAGCTAKDWVQLSRRRGGQQRPLSAGPEGPGLEKVRNLQRGTLHLYMDSQRPRSAVGRQAAPANMRDVGWQDPPTPRCGPRVFSKEVSSARRPPRI